MMQVRNPYRERHMRRIYKNPPIAEALCDFRFVPGQPWDWTIPGLIYAEVKQEFPAKSQVNPFQIEVSAGTQEASVQNVVSNVDRMQFLRQDEGALIQVGPDLMSVHHLKPYSDWETFKQMIARSLNVYRRVAEPQGIYRIGLRYINRLEISEQRVEIEDYLLAVPTVPSKVPQLFGGWSQRVEIPFEHANGMLLLQSGSIREEGQKGLIFLLDLDFVTLQPELVKLDSAMEWIERAHEQIENTFEECITPVTRRLLGEEAQHGG